jgi:hypothetical protein
MRIPTGFFAGFIIPLFAIALLNYTQDTYFILQKEHLIAGSIAQKERIRHAIAIRRFHPTTLVLGSSRIRMLFPQKQGTSKMQNYNAYLNVGSMYEIWRYFQFAQTVQKLDQVVIGLDLKSFLLDGAIGKGTQDFNEKRLSTIPWEYVPTLFKDYAHLLYSRAATKASLIQIHKKILKEENQPSFTDIFLRHFLHHIICQPQTRIQSDGPPLQVPPSVMLNMNLSLNYLQQIVASAHRDNIDLRLVIPSYHAIRTVVSTSQDSSLYDVWERKLVQLLEQEAMQYPETKPFPLWDFSGFNSITTEPIPSIEDPSLSMLWFIDESHLNKAGGEFVLDRIFGTDTAKIPEDFGVLLNINNIEAHLQNLHEQEESFYGTHPEAIKYWYELYNKICFSPLSEWDSRSMQ